jgi:hypothetical protein
MTAAAIVASTIFLGFPGKADLSRRRHSWPAPRPSLVPYIGPAGTGPCRQLPAEPCPASEEGVKRGPNRFGSVVRAPPGPGNPFWVRPATRSHPVCRRRTDEELLLVARREGGCRG